MRKIGVGAALIGPSPAIGQRSLTTSIHPPSAYLLRQVLNVHVGV